MRKVQKVLALTGCAALLVVGSVAGTLAYLSSQDQVKNTFTVGKVEITLDETNVDGKDASGNANVREVRDKANKYHLIPGETYTKDPTVTVKNPSETSYVYMIVTVKGYDQLTEALPKSGETASYYVKDTFLLQNLCDWQADSPWVYRGCKVADDGKAAEYRFVFDNDTTDSPIVNPVGKVTADRTLPALFNTITVPGKHINSNNITNLEDVEIVVDAYAIQASGFNGYNDAWKAGFGNGTQDYDIN